MDRRLIFPMILVVLTHFLTPVSAEHPIKFSVKRLTMDANEGCDIADIDGDKKLDVVAGRNWYRNGSWIPRPIRVIEDFPGYAHSNGDWAYDVNADGRPDVVSMSFLDGGVYWYENPGTESLTRGVLWKKHLLAETQFQTNETSYLVDLSGDGKPEWISDQWNPDNPAIIWSFETNKNNSNKSDSTNTAPRSPNHESPDKESKKNDGPTPVLKGHRIGKSTGHGIGFGDINNDQRNDILFGTGWYECPEGDVLQQPWKYHPDWEMTAACPMLVRDVNGDGINDLITSNAHDYGIYLWVGTGPDEDGDPKFEKKLIDDSFSQSHCLHMADLDGDGVDEIVAGKRVRAHNGSDPGGNDPPIVRYYVWNKATLTYDAYTLIEGSVGIGLQIRSADLDGDGDIDIVVAGKDGTQILFNQRIASEVK